MRIGVLGAGQLGMMLAQAGAPLGHTFRFLDPAPGACAAREGEFVNAPFDDERALADFATGLDVATYEFENVPVQAVRRLAEHVPVHPGPESLRVAQDRVLEKELFVEAGFDVGGVGPVDSEAALVEAIARIGSPGVLKARRGGYDGRSQVVLQDASEAPGAWRAIAGAPAIYEAFVSFRRELSLVSVRGRDGAMAFYPLVENRHDGGILRVTTAPAPGIDPEIEHAARDHATILMERLGHVGVLTVEFFEVPGARGSTHLLANEFAPRVHNSGHWTIEGAATSQFENHVRAVTGAALGDTSALAPTVMINIIGVAPDEPALRAVPHAHVHMYGKRPRPGRKLGHCTITGAPPDARRAALARIEALLAHAEDAAEA